MTNNLKNNPYPMALKLFLSDIILISIGTMLVMIAGILSNTSANSGGIIILGPIPIIFGKGENIFPIILIAVTLTIACIIFFLLTQRKQTEA